MKRDWDIYLVIGPRGTILWTVAFSGEVPSGVAWPKGTAFERRATVLSVDMTTAEAVMRLLCERRAESARIPKEERDRGK